jgi:hypothetical protein
LSLLTTVVILRRDASASSALPNRQEQTAANTIPLGGNRTLRMVEIRPGPEPHRDPILVVEPA